MKADRENLLAQLKTLVDERTKAYELRASLDKAATDLNSIQKENKDIKDFNTNLKKKMEKLCEKAKILASHIKNRKSATLLSKLASSMLEDL